MHFYAISDAEPKPNKITKLKYLGTLDEDNFEYLKEHKVIEKRYDYYKDIRWSSVQVSEKYQKVLNISEDKKQLFTASIAAFVEFLRLAHNQGKGIIGYSD